MKTRGWIEALSQRLRTSFYSGIADEISRLTRYYDSLAQYQPRQNDDGILFQQISCPNKTFLNVDQNLPAQFKDETLRTVTLLNGNFNHSFDIEALLKDIKAQICRSNRVIVVTYNPYLSAFFRFITLIGLRRGNLPTSFLTRTDLGNLARLSGFEILKVRPCGIFPFRLWGLGTLIEKVARELPGIRLLSLCNLIILRPELASSVSHPSLSILIPARNERGNIEQAILRLPDLGCPMEVIFIEGNSSDGTWEEILRVQEIHGKGRIKIQACQQSGKGKNDAVRLGFEKATHDVVTILDADLTMPPELLGRFYDAYRLGRADFVNGSRLVYPMEGDAMRPLNRLGNIFFAKALGLVLSTHLGDSLCGTKLFSRRDYQRFKNWRKDFGDFDPFGDFELIFPAVILGLGTVDVPIRYLSRTYGTTNISRFRDGWKLLMMTLRGLRSVRFSFGEA